MSYVKTINKVTIDGLISSLMKDNVIPTLSQHEYFYLRRSFDYPGSHSHKSIVSCYLYIEDIEVLLLEDINKNLYIVSFYYSLGLFDIMDLNMFFSKNLVLSMKGLYSLTHHELNYVSNIVKSYFGLREIRDNI